MTETWKEWKERPGGERFDLVVYDKHGTAFGEAHVEHHKAWGEWKWAIHDGSNHWGCAPTAEKACKVAELVFETLGKWFVCPSCGEHRERTGREMVGIGRMLCCEVCGDQLMENLTTLDQEVVNVMTEVKPRRLRRESENDVDD